jgi:diguanylate cyclase (GGDEF)-like protein
MPETILCVDDDPDILRTLEVTFRRGGFHVLSASGGSEALDLAMTHRPDLVVLDWMMPEVDGLEVVQRMRRDIRTADVRIVMLTARGLPSDEIAAMTLGADSYIVKPFDPEVLLARVRAVLRQSKAMLDLSPTTGMPGNARIEQLLERMVTEGDSFALLYCDLDDFKAYNDLRGFSEGNRMIKRTGELLQQTVIEHAGPDGFVGHIGGDDFVAIVPADVGETVAKAACDAFDDALASFYGAAELERGSVRLADRRGEVRDIPLVAMSIGVASASVRVFTHPGEAAAVASEMKTVAKRGRGSGYAVDRRTR